MRLEDAVLHELSFSWSRRIDRSTRLRIRTRHIDSTDHTLQRTIEDRLSDHLAVRTLPAKDISTTETFTSELYGALTTDQLTELILRTVLRLVDGRHTYTLAHEVDLSVHISRRTIQLVLSFSIREEDLSIAEDDRAGIRRPHVCILISRSGVLVPREPRLRAVVRAFGIVLVLLPTRQGLVEGIVDRGLALGRDVISTRVADGHSHTRVTILERMRGIVA